MKPLQPRYVYNIADLAAHFEQAHRGLAEKKSDHPMEDVMITAAFQDMSDAQLLLAAGYVTLITPVPLEDYVTREIDPSKPRPTHLRELGIDDRLITLGPQPQFV